MALRSLGFQEERDLRIHAQQELLQAKQHHAATVERLNARVTSLEQELAMARTKAGFAERTAEMLRREMASTTAQVDVARAEVKEAQEALEASEQTVARLTAELASERAAYARLEQVWAVDTQKSQQEVERTREHLQTQRDEALKAAKASQSSEMARSAEQVARRHTEEILELERAARKAIEEQLQQQKTDVIPALEHALQDREAELAAALRELQAVKERLQCLELQAGENARRLSELSESYGAADAERQQLLVHNLQLQEAMEAQMQYDKQLRLKLEQDVELLQLATAQTE